MKNKIYDVSDEQFTKIRNKYERLMYAIAYRIGGDPVLHSFEDSIQDLQMAALDACEAYGRKMDMTFDEFWGTEAFDKYIKSTMWNKKNNMGKQIQKVWHINHAISIEDDTCEAGIHPVFDYPDLSALLIDFALDEEEQKIASEILGETKLVKPNGSINLSQLSRSLGMEKKDVKGILMRLRNTLTGGYNEGENNGN